eukprot:7008411-Prymnesium_polylepis.1
MACTLPHPHMACTLPHMACTLAGWTMREMTPLAARSMRAASCPNSGRQPSDRQADGREARAEGRAGGNPRPGREGCDAIPRAGRTALR